MGQNKIVVTGGSGMVGKSLKKIMPNAIYLSSKDYDLTSEKGVAQMYYDHKPTIVIHLAAKVGGIIDNINKPGEYFTDNVLMNTLLLEYARFHGVERFIGVLSTCIYPDKVDNYPMTEDMLHMGPPTATNFSYGYAKRSLAVQIDAYNKEYGTKYQYLIPCNLYGECFSEDTEVLTENGIKNIKDISLGEFIFTLNPETHDLEKHKVTQLHKLEDEEFYSFKGSSVDFEVTKNHDLYFKTTAGFVKKKAYTFDNKLGKEFGQITLAHHNIVDSKVKLIENIDLSKYLDDNHILLENGMVKDFIHSKCKEMPTTFNYLDFSEFLGWYISEGSVCTTTKSLNENLDRGQVRISQSKEKNPENYSKIHSLLTRMKIPFGCDDFSFYFSSRLFINYIKENIGLGSDDKRIPSEFLKLETPSILKEALFNSLMLGDGTLSRNTYTTKSNKLKNDFFMLSFLLGKKISNISLDNGCWRIYIKNKKQNSTVKYKNISKEKCEKKNFYCITVEKNHIIYAGRNGKFNWIGQCDNYENENKMHFVSSLIKKIHEAKTNGDDKITLFGTGTPLRQFMHSDDLAKVIKRCIDDEVYESFNVATEQNVSIDDIARTALRACEATNLKIEYDSSKPDGQFRKDVSVEKMKSLFPDFKATRLYHGIGSTYSILKQTWKEKI